MGEGGPAEPHLISHAHQRVHFFEKQALLLKNFPTTDDPAMAFIKKAVCERQKGRRIIFLKSSRRKCTFAAGSYVTWTNTS